MQQYSMGEYVEGQLMRLTLGKLAQQVRTTTGYCSVYNYSYF